MSKIELVRIGNEVFYNDVQLTIVKQATKGPGKEVVNIEKVPNSLQSWVSLSKLKEGKNVIETKKTNRTSSSYTLTKEEQEQVNKLQKQIDAIIEVAKKRFVPKSKSISEMSIEEIQEYLKTKKEELKK